MKWVTRERPKIDRIACPWLIQRFIEKQPEFLYVPADQVLATAEKTGAIPYDIPGVKFSHVGEKCSFDAFIAEYRLDAPGLDRLADIVRGADTSRLDLTPQSRLSGNLNEWWFDRTAVLEAARNQADIGRRIGTDLSVAWTWRPFFTQNIVLRVSGAALLPGGGFKDLYGDRHSSYYSLLGNLIVTY